MFRKHLTQKHDREPDELDITPFLNLMVALVPFLLVTAVFSRVAILELNLPNGSENESDNAEDTIEVVIRDTAIELSLNDKIESSFDKSDAGYDLSALALSLSGLKKKFPDKTDVTILLEKHIKYDHLIAVMDIVRGSRQSEKGVAPANIIVLFPDISIGEAP